MVSAMNLGPYYYIQHMILALKFNEEYERNTT
jgi:hypothetical protein